MFRATAKCNLDRWITRVISVSTGLKWGMIGSSQLLGPDYMSRAGPVSRAASVCQDDFQAGIT